MKAINESELDVALDKLKTVRHIAEQCMESEDHYVTVMMKTVLEVIDE